MQTVCLIDAIPATVRPPTLIGDNGLDSHLNLQGLTDQSPLPIAPVIPIKKWTLITRKRLKTELKMSKEKIYRQLHLGRITFRPG